MVLFVLGAGATRACSFVTANTRPCLPPLDADFFALLQKVENTKHRRLITEVITDVVTLFGNNFKVSLETMFATLEHTIRMLKTTGDNRQFQRTRLVAMRDRLLQAIAVVLEESLCEPGAGGGSSRQPEECEHHARLVSESLDPGDDIISFNYDCTIGFALKKHAAGKWNARYGYGFDLGSRGHNLSGDQYWTPNPSATKETTAHLYKLHGSLHFQIGETNKSKVILKQRPYTRQHGNLKFSIIPPESNKTYDKGVFAGLWKRAASAIKRAEHIVFGYSLPATDLHSTALFRTAVTTGGLISLNMVNPDAETRKRTRSVLQRGLKDSSRVLSFNSTGEFLASNPRTWRV